MGVDMGYQIQMLKQMLESFAPMFASLGIKMKIDRIDIAPKDCPDKCIDIVWRIEGQDDYVIEQLRKKLVEGASKKEVIPSPDGGE